MKFIYIIGFICLSVFDVKAQNDSIPAKKKYISNTRFTMLIDARTAVELKTGDVQKAEFFICSELDIPLAKNFRLRMIGRFYAEVMDNLEPGKPLENTVSDFTKRGFIGDRFEAELREFYLDWKIGKHYLTIGKQQIVWGKSDGLKILDLVNPTNFREFLLDDFDNSRIPLWSIKADLKLSKRVNAQLIWIPDLTYHVFPPPDGAFFPGALFSIPPAGYTVMNNSVVKPKSPIQDADYGIRFSAFLNGWGITLNYLYQYDNFPVSKTVVDEINSEIILNPIFKRYHLLGSTFSNAFGSFTVRGEIGYSKDKYFSSSNLNVEEGIFNSDQIIGVIGIEYAGISNSTVSFQLFEDYIFDNQDVVGRRASETNASLLINRRFANETITASVICVQNLNVGDGFVRPKVDYLLLNNLTATLSADLFYGNSTHLFGQFGHLNRVSLGFQMGI
jgi:hypothetical protein